MDTLPFKISMPRLDLKIELARRRAEAERKAARHVPMTGESSFEKNDHQPPTIQRKGST